MRGPHTVLLGHCRGVTLRDVTIRDSANYAFFFLHSQQVRVENAVFEGGWDGVHFRGSPAAWNRDVRITGCRFFTGDDSIAGHLHRRRVVENCVINSSCNGVRLIGPARRLSFAKCEFYGPGKFEHRTSRRTNMLAALCLQPSAWGKQPGPLEDVSARDLTMRDVSCAFHVVVRPGNTARGLTFERVKATGVYRAAASVESWGEPTFADVVFRDVQIEYTGGGTADDAKLAVRQPGVDARKLPAWGFFVRGVHDLTLERVSLDTAGAGSPAGAHGRQRRVASPAGVPPPRTARGSRPAGPDCRDANGEGLKWDRLPVGYPRGRRSSAQESRDAGRESLRTWPTAERTFLV